MQEDIINDIEIMFEDILGQMLENNNVEGLPEKLNDADRQWSVYDQV